MKSLKMFSDKLQNVPAIQYLAMFTGTLNILSYGMHYGWPSPSIPILLQNNSTIPMTNDQGSWVIVILPVGNVCGTLLNVVILGMFGCKKVILFASFPFFISWLMIAYARSIEVLLAARFIAGISQGFTYCALVVYLGEISDPRIRGLLCASLSHMRILGILLIDIIGSHLTLWMSGLVSSVIPVLCLITFCWMPESPYYFIKKGQYDEARHSLVILNSRKDIEADMERIVQGIKDQNKETTSWLDLFRDKCHRKPLLISGGVRLIQQLCGHGAITFYAQAIFQESQSAIPSSTAANIYFAIQLVFTICSSILVDKVGRKPLMVVSIIGAGLGLSMQGIYFYILNFTDINTASFSWVPLAALTFYVVIFSVGMQVIPTVLLGELFATDVKIFAVCVMDIFCNVCLIGTSKIFQFTKDTYGIHIPFFIFAFCCWLGLFFIIFVVQETKGKTLEDIQLDFKKHKPGVEAEPPASFRTILADRY